MATAKTTKAAAPASTPAKLTYKGMYKFITIIQREEEGVSKQIDGLFQTQRPSFDLI